MRGKLSTTLYSSGQKMMLTERVQQINEETQSYKIHTQTHIRR